MTKTEAEERDEQADHIAKELALVLARDGAIPGKSATAIANIARKAFITGWGACSDFKQEADTLEKLTRVLGIEGTAPVRPAGSR